MAGMELKGARVLLTGATGGIGQAIATDLHDRGCELVLTGRRVELLAQLAEATGATTIAADLAERSEVERLIAETGRIDILVANAALPSSGAVLDYTPEQVTRSLVVNLEAPIQLARAAAEQMAERGRGHIVLMGSVAGIASSAATAIYNTTKFGLRGFALGFRQDMHGTGVGVSLVAPGFVRDAGMFAESGAKLPPGVRTVSPEDVAKAVVRAVEKDSAEIVVAPVEMRVGARMGSVFPDLAALVQRTVGGQRFGEEVSEGQRERR